MGVYGKRYDVKKKKNTNHLFFTFYSNCCSSTPNNTRDSSSSAFFTEAFRRRLDFLVETSTDDDDDVRFEAYPSSYALNGSLNNEFVDLATEFVVYLDDEEVARAADSSTLATNPALRSSSVGKFKRGRSK